MKNCKGNVLVYVLLAVALMAALTFTLTRDGNDTGTTALDETKINLMASELIRHAASAEMAVQQMEQWGITYDQILFDLPANSGYTGYTSLQIYHPSGGGLNVFNASDDFYDIANARGWRWQNQTNVGWTSTTATDIIYTFQDVNGDICSAINEILHGDPTVPQDVSVGFNAVLWSGSGVNTDFINASCPECVNKKRFCIENNSSDENYAFYNIVGAR